jgi:single-strand DNA-binding protein
MGNLGQDPDTRYMPSGTALTQISVATNRSWKDKQSGEQKDETSWHRCVAYGKTAETIAEHFTKGRKILIEGRLKYGSYEKDGITRYTTDIVIDRFEFVEKKGGDRDPHAADRDQDGMPPRSRTDADDSEPPRSDGDPGPSDEDFDDDIPF